jgi:DNA-binding response OmpR family regulator
MGSTDRIRVLLLEEDGIQRQIIREYLGMDPRFEVLEAKGAFHVLTLCESNLLGISLALLDMEYSKVDGVNLVLSLRRMNSGLIILGMTDRRPEVFSDSRLRRARAGFISKPFAPLHLHRSIAALMALEGRGNRIPSGQVLQPGSAGPGLVVNEGRRVHGQTSA